MTWAGLFARAPRRGTSPLLGLLGGVSAQLVGLEGAGFGKDQPLGQDGPPTPLRLLTPPHRTALGYAGGTATCKQATRR